MGRRRISGAEAGPRRARGLSLTLRQDSPIIQLSGTVRYGDKSERVRQSTGIDSRTPDAWERAEQVRIRVEGEILDRLVHGVAVSRLFASIVADYVRNADPGAADLRNLIELTQEFGETPASDISGNAIRHFYDRRFPKGSPATRRRHENTLFAVLSYALRCGEIVLLPRYEKAKPRPRRGSGMAKRFLPGEAELIISCALPHLRPIMATLYSTGARVAEALYLAKSDFVLVPGQGRVHFPATKNGDAYTAPLHDFAVTVLRDWLAVRDDKHPEMFLTPKGRPYVRTKGRGGQISGAFEKARDRAVALLRGQGLHDRARIIAQATPHWFRHNLANAMRDAGADLKTIMEAGRWKSPRVVLETYLNDTPARTEAMVRNLNFGTDSTQLNHRAMKRKAS